jgi:phosphate uptake regulator
MLILFKRAKLELRKLQKTPDGTFFTTLPKSWINRLGLNQGAVLSLTERRNGKIVLGPYIEVERKIEEATLKPSTLIEREIIEKYLLGYDVIGIESEEMIDLELREKVKRTLRRLVGLEIVEEDFKKITVQCLLESSLLIPDKIMRRLHLITSAMQKDSFLAIAHGNLKLANTVIERDEEVDRLYFLLVRLIRKAINEPSICEKLSTTPVDCLDYRLLVSFMESFADCSVKIAENALSLTRRKLPEKIVSFFERAGEMVHAMYNDAVNSVFTRNLKAAAEITRKYEELKRLLKEIEVLLLEMPRDEMERLTPAIMALNRMYDINVDIADLTVTR